jgi:PAS domain S-box-containing protein
LEGSVPTVVNNRPSSTIDAELFRLLVHSVKDYAIFLLDTGGRVATWNEGAQRIKGYAEEEIVGKHLSVFYPPEVAASGWPDYELTVATAEGRFEDEGWRVRKDGSRFWADVVITALRDSTGVHRGFAKVTRDLTERKFSEEALRQSEERYRMLIDGVRDYAIFMLDVDGHVVTWNAGAQRLKGYSAPEIIGQHFSRFYPPEALAANWPARELEFARADGRLEDEGWRVRKDGSLFWANVLITAVYNRHGQLQGFSKVTRDMTERRKLEERTRQLNDELQLRVDELAVTNRALAAKSRENEAFVYSVSHDVRGPLVNIQGFSKELERSCSELIDSIAMDPITDVQRERVRRIVDEDMAESLRFMQTSVQHLSNIVDALLRLSRLGRVVYRNELVNVAEIVRRVLDSARGRIDQERAEVVLGDLPPAWSDSSAVEQIFANLIANALHYRDPARPLRIEIGGMASKERKSVVYSIKDSGAGIPSGALPKLFTAFRRFHPQAGGGEGMGLATVRRIVERQHGDIRVDSRVGEGSTFFLELPNTPRQEES